MNFLSPKFDSKDFSIECWCWMFSTVAVFIINIHFEELPLGDFLSQLLQFDVDVGVWRELTRCLLPAPLLTASQHQTLGTAMCRMWHDLADLWWHRKVYWAWKRIVCERVQMTWIWQGTRLRKYFFCETTIGQYLARMSSHLEILFPWKSRQIQGVPNKWVYYINDKFSSNWKVIHV